MTVCAQPRWPAGCVLPRVLLLLDSVVLTCWQVLDPVRWAELQQESQVDNLTLTRPCTLHYPQPSIMPASNSRPLTPQGAASALGGGGCDVSSDVNSVSGQRRRRGCDSALALRELQQCERGGVAHCHLRLQRPPAGECLLTAHKP